MELFAILFFYSITQFSDYFIIIIIIIFTSQIITVRFRFLNMLNFLLHFILLQNCTSLWGSKCHRPLNEMCC